MDMEHTPALIETATDSKAWPFEEARKLLQRMERMKSPPAEILFETGYGPSGLPHLGTFGEVARTTMVRHAFSILSDVPTRLLCFSDDMDGLRKVPDNVPNQELLAQHLNKPLTQVPDPFETHASFGAHNNARLHGVPRCLSASTTSSSSSTDYYASGRFDQALLRVLEVLRQDHGHHAADARRGAAQDLFSPFLPVCPRTGHVLQVPLDRAQRRQGHGDLCRPGDRRGASRCRSPAATCKCQWKADWAHALVRARRRLRDVGQGPD